MIEISGGPHSRCFDVGSARRHVGTRELRIIALEFSGLIPPTGDTRLQAAKPAMPARSKTQLLNRGFKSLAARNATFLRRS